MTPEIIINTAVAVKDKTKKAFGELVEAEMVKIRKKTKPVNSWHEGYGVLIEEVDELWDEVKKKTSQRDKENMTKELSQIAAVCQKIYEDLL